MIVCVGEILADMIAQNNGVVCYERRAGGAPFNVACGVARLGGEAGFAGRTGDDAVGRWLKEYAEERGIGYLDIVCDADRNTTLAFVELSEKGERSFSFYRKNTADAYVDADPYGLAAKADILHVGSLMLSLKRGREYADRLFAAAERAGKRSSFDMNYREGLFAAEDVLPYMHRADIVKLSEEEAAMFGKPEEVARRLSRGRLLALTMGAKGSAFCLDGGFETVPSIDVRIADTTGAGDAFMAGLLTALGKETRYTDGLLRRSFRYANVCGALTATARGAIDALPSRQDVERYV